ncbi:MAG: ABC-F family ATP-binding cassette domain-containing protein [Syntrophomonadaceae bacterium]|nr:ABC-F family ATP-binding cassette domain-containing protein [Syntrophomonadaceae bacterium]
MIVLQVNKLNQSFADREVLKQVSLVVQEKQRVGLVGLNGSGKTTLLRCLTGELHPDSGEVIRPSHLTLGCLEQMPDNLPGATAWDAVMQSFADLLDKRLLMRDLEAKMASAGADTDRVMEQYARIMEEYEQANGYACENMARRILTGLGFRSEEFQQPFDSFSGGQKTRLNLGRLLAMAPAILLLDEPTNHLDTGSVEWLENFVINYPGTVLAVSHDRMFLDRVATHIGELRGGKLTMYTGNYKAYLQKSALQDLAEQRALQKQQQYIQRTEEYIRRFKAGIKSKQARGRQAQLDRLEHLEVPVRERSIGRKELTINQESANDVLTIERLCKSYGGPKLLENISLKVRKGDKLALIGPNGCGKTTLLKLINGQILADQGEIRLGSRVELACFSQEHEDLDPNRTLLDEIIYNFDLTLEEARTALGGMLFSEDEVLKNIGSLSGGELGRLEFLKIILSGANFLILDEPTNHLDIASCQVVENMLQNFQGTVLLVSHDRYFIDQVAGRVIAIEDGHIEQYWGNYSYYHEKQQEKPSSTPAEQGKPQEKLRPDWRQREAQKERKRSQRRLNQELTSLEETITATENRKSELEKLLSDPDTYNNEEQARSLTAEFRDLEQRLGLFYQRWEGLQEELEKIAE